MITKIQTRNGYVNNYNYLYAKSTKNRTITNNLNSDALVSNQSSMGISQNYNLNFKGFFNINLGKKAVTNPFAKTTYKEISAPAMEVIEQARETAKKFANKEINHYHIISLAILDTLGFLSLYDNGEPDLNDVSNESGVGYFRNSFTDKIFEEDEYREKFEAVLSEKLNSLNEILSKTSSSHIKEPNFADNLVKDIIYEKSSVTLTDDNLTVIDGLDIYNGTFNTNIKDVKNFIKDLDMKINDIYQLEDSTNKNRIHFPNYDDKAEIVMKNLNKGTNMFITYDSTKIEPNSFVPSLRKVFAKSKGKFNPGNTEIIELNQNISLEFLIDKINMLKKNNNKNYILMFSQQNLIKNKQLDLSSFESNGFYESDYLKMFKNTPKNVGLVVFDTKDSYLSTLSIEEMFKAIRDTAEVSIPVLTKEDVHNALLNSSFLKENNINISKKALEKVVETSTQMEGIFPEKTIDLLNKISKYYINKSKINIDDVNEFIKESEHLFKKTGNESSIEIIFNTEKTLNDIVGKYNTKREAENVIRKIKDNTIGTKGFIIYSQDGSVGAGRRHTAEVIAGESKVPFVSINTMDFGTEEVDLFGENSVSPEAAIKKLFSLVSTQAETNSHKSAVLFIENFEYFSIGEMISEYYQKALAQLIREMTNAEKKGLNIVIIGSVSDPGLLGKAAAKSFKFNNNIEVSSPAINRSEREEILQHMINENGIKLAGTEEENKKLINSMAKTLRGFSFIDLKNFVKKSETIATERGHDTVRKEDMIESYLRLTTGSPNVGQIPKHEKELTTKHECGHAITLQIMNDLMHKAGKEWMIPDTVNFITLDPRAYYGGAMYEVTDTNSEHCFENKFTDLICDYGGHSAEKVLSGIDGSWGITCDLDLATSTAEKMVTAMGMGHNTGKISIVNMYGSEDFQRNITLNLKNKIEKDVDVITKNALLASDMIVEAYADFINKFSDKYSPKVGTGDCLVDGDQFRKELAEWKTEQTAEKLAELDTLDKILLEIIDNTKKGKLY